MAPLPGPQVSASGLLHLPASAWNSPTPDICPDLPIPRHPPLLKRHPSESPSLPAPLRTFSPSSPDFFLHTTSQRFRLGFFCGLSCPLECKICEVCTVKVVRTNKTTTKHDGTLRSYNSLGAQKYWLLVWMLRSEAGEGHLHLWEKHQISRIRFS